MWLDFDLFSGAEESDPILVVTAISGSDGEETIQDEEFGEIGFPDQVPTQDEWEKRAKEYQTAQRKDDKDGEAAVQAYIAALKGWKRDVAAQFDEIVQSEVLDLRCAVKWHQTFYGVDDEG